jgi:transcriptional regulator with XRE-family HTH domain
MTAISIDARGKANVGTVRLVGKNRPRGRSISPAMRVARGLWPSKTANELAGLTGASVRTAERWLAGERTLSAGALSALLRSEYGLDFLAAVMADAQPRWWQRIQAYFAAIDAQRLQRAARRKLKEAIDADADLTAAIARADALLVQDEDFYRPQSDAVRAVARVPDRALVRRRS